LPDWRIEKSAITARKHGHEVIFGGGLIDKYKNDTFSELYRVHWTAKARYGIPGYWDAVKKQVERIIKEVRPDVIHAHNLFSARMVSDFGIPFVYDDHEYWSSHVRLLNEMVGSLIAVGKKRLLQSVLSLPIKVRRMLINNCITHLWSKWEKEIVSRHPTITVSVKIAEELEKKSHGNKKIFVVPNFPLTSEICQSKEPLSYTTVSCTYAGGDGLNKERYPNRNIDGLTEVFNKRDIGTLTIIGWDGYSSDKVRYTGHLERSEMYKEMFRHSIGLIPWKRHWSHSFVSPNKAYEYAHGGLFVMCTDSFKAVPEILKNNCKTFEDYSALVSQLEYFQTKPEELYNKRLQSLEFARKNLVWERNENNILTAYKYC
jgi:glycosyltransferase involved in cell wall biosynthesis